MKLRYCWLAVLAAAALPAADAQTRSAADALRLYVLDGGVLASDPSRYRLTPEEVQSAPLAVAAYLVVHPRGVLLWEAGAIADEERTAEAGVEQRVVRADGAERFVTLAEPLVDVLQASEEPTRRARADVEAFLERTGAALWIQHDLVGHRDLKHAPAYYD